MLLVTATGLEDVGRLSTALKKAGATDLRRELHRGIGRATKPPRKEIKARAPEFLPNRYAAVLVPRLRFTQLIRGLGVAVVTKAKGQTTLRHVGALERGRLRHPVFANREVWATQPVRPGFVSEPFTDAKPQMREEIHQAMETVAEKIARAV